MKSFKEFFANTYVTPQVAVDGMFEYRGIPRATGKLIVKWTKDGVWGSADKSKYVDAFLNLRDRIPKKFASVPSGIVYRGIKMDDDIERSLLRGEQTVKIKPHVIESWTYSPRTASTYAENGVMLKAKTNSKCILYMSNELAEYLFIRNFLVNIDEVIVKGNLLSTITADDVYKYGR